MRFVLGFDGGGTKTDCVLMDAQGEIRGCSHAGPSNPFRIGIEAAAASLQAAAMQAIASFPAARESIRAVVAGLAGVSDPDRAVKMTAELKRLFPAAVVQVCTDLEVSLFAAGDGPAVLLVAGTGSAAVGRDAAGRVFRAGGHGPAGSDEGSAFHIGRSACEAARRPASGRVSILGAPILQELGFRNWEELEARASASPDEVYPRVFPLVVRAAEAGDPAAREILATAASDLANLAVRVIEALSLRDTPFALAKAGGVHGRSPFLDECMDSLLRQAAPLARIAPLAMPPAEAAARMALRLAAKSSAEQSQS